MNDVERILGELGEHKRATDRRLDKLEKEVARGFESIGKEIRTLDRWKWKKAGETGVISAVMAFLVYLIIGK